jgi:tetratricopeptide (TPR) repeat protein
MMKTKILLFPAFVWILLASCVHLKEARQAFEAKEYQTAENLLKEAIASDSTNSEAYFLLSKTYMAMNKLESASESIQKSFNLNPISKKIQQEQSHIQIRLGDRLLARGKEQRALIQYKTAERYDSTHYDLAHRVGNLYLRLGSLQEASVRYRRLVSHYPDSTKAKTRLEQIKKREYKAKTLYEKGLKEFKKNALSSAGSSFTKALKEKSDFHDAKYHSLITQGRLLYKKGSPNALWDAIVAFGEAGSMEEKRAEPHYWLGMAYGKKDSRDFSNAIAHLKTALELEPNGPFAGESRKKLQEMKKQKEKYDEFFGRNKK